MNLQALLKLQQYCVYQDRNHQEVRSKLLKMKIYGDGLEEIMASLIEDDFLNEERFAKAYASGKFRINYWGKNKIKMQLKSKRISEYCIKVALDQIEQEEYRASLQKILEKKSRELKGKSLNSYQLKSKLYQFAHGRGFESFMISAALESILD